MGCILLLEPDKWLADTYAASLRTRHHDVMACASAQQAVSLADATTPDVVVLELQLVAHSGIEFLYEFRSYADWREIPAIIVSHVPPAEFAKSSRLLAERLGVKAYRYKPRTDLRTLLRVVESVLLPV